MFFWYGEVPYQDETFANLDLRYYRLMAQEAPGIHSEIEKPFAYRLLGPYLAGLMPLDDPMAFKIFTVLFLAILIIVFYSFLIRNEISPKIALFITVLFTSNKYFFGYPAWNYFQINDLLALIFLLFALIAMQRQDWLKFGFYLFVGVLAREIVLIMIPVAFVFMLESKDRQNEKYYPLLASVRRAGGYQGHANIIGHS